MRSESFVVGVNQRNDNRPRTHRALSTGFKPPRSRFTVALVFENFLFELSRLLLEAFAVVPRLA